MPKQDDARDALLAHEWTEEEWDKLPEAPPLMNKKTNGTAILTCKNHPTYRWMKTKYTLPGEQRDFIGHGVLMFDGEEGGKPSCNFNMSERGIGERGEEFAKEYREHYTPECDCPMSDLVFLAWAYPDGEG